ncbi:hypothetical protein OB920_14020 [Halobacteria archaeon HArc-gm2]|nr:hypothetical protein [Halobacteria archaeon HArc-gm2]
MAERTDELTRNGDGGGKRADEDVVGIDSDEFGVDADGTVASPDEHGTEFGVGASTSTPAETTDAASSRVGRVKRRASSVFSPTTFVLQLGAALVGVFVLGNLIPLVPFAGFLGIFLMAGLVGTLSAKPRYLEAAAAGGASGALALFLGAMGLSVVTGGMVPIAGAAVGALAAVGGFYAGRDLRDGVTRDL